MDNLAPRSAFFSAGIFVQLPPSQLDKVPTWEVFTLWGIMILFLANAISWFPGKKWPFFSFWGAMSASLIVFGMRWPWFGRTLIGAIISWGVVYMVMSLKKQDEE